MQGRRGEAGWPDLASADLHFLRCLFGNATTDLSLAQKLAFISFEEKTKKSKEKEKGREERKKRKEEEKQSRGRKLKKRRREGRRKEEEEHDLEMELVFFFIRTSGLCWGKNGYVKLVVDDLVCG
jgi:hypothetical protein